MGGLRIVVGLFPAVAVHTVRIYHQFELHSRILQGINHLKGILEMDIVVTRAMSESEAGRAF